MRTKRIKPASLSISVDLSSLTETWVRFICAFRVILFVTISSFSSAALSQVGSENNQQVSVLLAEIESKNKTRSIYDARSHRKISDIEFNSGFKIISRQDNWNIVEFNQKTVPGWVSSDYVKVANGRAEVNARRLNMRLRPSINASVMLQLERGYSSRILARKNGFVSVLAPKDYRVAIFSGSDSEAKQVSSTDPIRTPAHSTEISLPEKKFAPTIDPQTNATTKLRTTDLTEGGNLGQRVSDGDRLHIIAPGDAVSLRVFGEEDLSIENVRVPESGRVSFPLIGSVFVAGRTTRQIETSVADLLAKGYVKSPRLSVSISSYRPVFIRGAVAKPGSFAYSEGLTVGNLIALAGGSKKSAKRNGVSILRDGKVVEESLSSGSLVKVLSGDVLNVEEEFGVQDNGGTYIYLHGEVASPGEYEYRRGLTVEKAIVLAGGFTLRSSRKKISVTRYADVELNQEPEKLKKVKLHIAIKPGDIINVGASWF